MATEFIDDPIVPLLLTVPGATHATLYHPGWFGLEEDEPSQAFIGVPGETVYGFADVPALAAYVSSADLRGMAPGPDIDRVLSWSAQDYADRLCAYDLVQIPELADGELAEEEQAMLGSTLALGLDLLDFLEIENEHAEALREDEDVSKLASGDELLAVFTAARHRKHVVALLAEHWAPCIDRIGRGFSTPS